MILMWTLGKQSGDGLRGEIRGADGSVWIKEQVFLTEELTEGAEKERGEAGSARERGGVSGLGVGYTVYCTRIGYHLSIAIFVYCMVIRTAGADSNGRGGSCGD
jgi:hypothetical protein